MAPSPPAKDFAYLPDDGRPPRLIRFTRLNDGLVATLDHAKNLLRVDQQYFDALPPTEQGYVLGTHELELRLKEVGGRLTAY